MVRTLVLFALGGAMAGCGDPRSDCAIIENLFDSTDTLTTAVPAGCYGAATATHPVSALWEGPPRGHGSWQEDGVDAKSIGIAPDGKGACVWTVVHDLAESTDERWESVRTVLVRSRKVVSGSWTYNTFQKSAPAGSAPSCAAAFTSTFKERP